MSEWATKPLGELVTFQKGRKVSTSPHPLDGYMEYLGAGKLSGSFDGYASLELAVLAEETDVLMLWDGERSGLCHTGLAGVVSSTVSKLTPKDSINTLLLYYFLLQRFEWIQHRRTGTGVPHVPKDLGRILHISYPIDGHEQQKIAHILHTTDRAIEQTEVLIDKYQQIKAGLMHDLFTRGIGPAGQLRPPREQAPELYQETPIGWIPKAWGYDYLSSLLARIPNNLRSGPFGSALLKSELTETGIPFLGIDNIHVEQFKDVFRRYVPEKKFSELKRYAVRPRDVVITIMGTVGRSAVIPNDIGPALSSKHLWTMTFDSELVIPELVCWQLNYAPWVQSWFRRETQGGIMDAVQSSTLRAVVMPVIPMNEQQQIFLKYSNVNSTISREQKKLEKFCMEKLGLMHDLLSGRVPVQIKESEASHV